MKLTKNKHKNEHIQAAQRSAIVNPTLHASTAACAMRMRPAQAQAHTRNVCAVIVCPGSGRVACDAIYIQYNFGCYELHTLECIHHIHLLPRV